MSDEDKKALNEFRGQQSSADTSHEYAKAQRASKNLLEAGKERRLTPVEFKQLRTSQQRATQLGEQLQQKAQQTQKDMLKLQRLLNLPIKKSKPSSLHTFLQQAKARHQKECSELAIWKDVCNKVEQKRGLTAEEQQKYQEFCKYSKEIKVDELSVNQAYFTRQSEKVLQESCPDIDTLSNQAYEELLLKIRQRKKRQELFGRIEEGLAAVNT